MAGVIDGRPSWEQWEDMGRVGHATAAAMWARTDLRPADVDVAQLYDGFTIEAVWWLEALGFCGPGEAGAFVEGGTRIALDGELPLNTWGGQLSGGRLHAALRPHRRGGAPAAGRGRRPAGGGRRGGGGDERRRVRGGRRPAHRRCDREPSDDRSRGSERWWSARTGRGQGGDRDRGRVDARARASARARPAAVVLAREGARVLLRRPRARAGRGDAALIEDEGGEAEVFARRLHQGRRVRGDGARPRSTRSAASTSW